MARFIARYKNYSHGVRSEVAEQRLGRASIVVERGLEAQFGEGKIHGYESEAAIAALSFPGLPEDRDTGAEVEAHSRLGVFDSEQAQRDLRWSDEDTELVVSTLRESLLYGVDYIEVEKPRAPAPWAGYDNLEDADRIAELVIETGTDPAVAIAYELENENRESVLAALELLVSDDEPEGEPDIVVEA